MSGDEVKGNFDYQKGIEYISKLLKQELNY